MVAVSRRAVALGLLVLALLLMARPVAAGPPDAEPPTDSEVATGSEPMPMSSISVAPTFVHEPLMPIDPERMRLIWRPASVAWPLVPLSTGVDDFAQLAARLQPREAMLAGQAAVPSVRGPVEIDEQRAVGVWVAALETVRVRQISEPVPLRFIRGVDGNLAVLESGREVAPGPNGERRFELHQPPSTGAVWSIEADAPTTVIIERVEERPTRYVTVEVEYDILKWIAAHGAADAMPSLLEPDDDLAYRLHVHAAIERELTRLGAGDRKLAAAAEAWRKLAAINTLDRTRPAVTPYYVRDPKRLRPLPLEGTRPVWLATDDTRDYRLAEKPRRWTIDRRGPGQLRVAGRAWAPKDTELRAAELRVYSNGRLLERIALSDRHAVHSLDPDTALPLLLPLLTEDGEPVGEFAAANVILAPGRHTYELELVGGPALLEIEGTQRTEASRLSARGLTPRKQARKATRALAKARAPERVWLELLLADELLEPMSMGPDDPRIDALAERSPLLAVAVLGELAADDHIDEEAFAALVDRVRPWFAKLARDSTIEPMVRGQLRAHWLMLASVHGRWWLLDGLLERVHGGADPIAELPVPGLRLLAELLGPTRATVRSPALAVLELARARSPADEGLREQALRLWTMSSRWSRRRPVSLDPAVPLEPAGEWLVPREAVPADPAELLSTWLRLEVGTPVRVRAKLGADAIRREFDGEEVRPDNLRLRLLDIYVATPDQDPSPITLRVDDQSWWSPMLFGVQRHRISVAEGVHEIQLDGPAETVAWAELPPADDQPREPTDLGRRERMWPLSRSLWTVPGPAVPGTVRLELRWLSDVEPRPVRITMRELGDHPPGQTPPMRTIVFDPRTPTGTPPMMLDPDATPITGSTRASLRHELTLPIRASTEVLGFDVEGQLEIAASISIRRGLKPGDVLESERGQASGDAPDPEFDEVFDGLTALDGPGMLEELRDLSRLLLLTEDDLERRARRAALLLIVGETGNARADLVRLAAAGDHEESIERRELADALLAELERRFDALIEPREIVVDPSRGDTPTLVEPALTAVATRMEREPPFIDPWLEKWAQLRDKPLDEALMETAAEIEHLQAQRDDAPRIDDARLLGQLTHAHLLASDPQRARDAGRVWLELYGRTPGQPGTLREPLAIALASVDPLLRHLDDPGSDARDAGLAYGLARELEPAYGHTSVRRLAFVAALRSDWSTIDHSEHNSGFEMLELPVAQIDRTPEALVREALMVAPWPAGEAEELHPSRKGVLAWDAVPGTVRAEFWCRAARPDLIAIGGARADDPDSLGRAKLSLRLRADGRDEKVDERTSIEVADAELVSVDLSITKTARHRLEVVLSDDPLWLCSWRTRTSTTAKPDDGVVVEARRRAQWWTAGARTEVELVVLGPASLQLQSRAVTNSNPADQATKLVTTIERLGDKDSVEQAEFMLDAERERAVITESRRQFEVAHTSGHTLLLTDPVPYRIRVRTDRGRALVRAQVRRDRGDIPPPAQFSIREIEHPEPLVPEDFDWRNLGLAGPVVARDELEPIKNRWGSLDARVTVGLDDLSDVDNFAPRVGVFARVGWRREMIPDLLWLSVAAQAGVRAQSAPAFGGLFRIGSVIPVVGLRVAAEVDALGSSFLGRPAGSVRVHGFVDRPFQLGRHFQLRPGVTAGWRWQSLDPTTAAAGGPLQAHPRVYNTYIEHHPLLLQPELELRWFVFQDMAVWALADMLPNSDLRSIDHIDVELGLDGIGRQPGPWVPIWGASYQVSRRFLDAHRSQNELRHRISLELGLGVWLRDVVRIAFGAGYQLYMTPVLLPEANWMRNVFELWIRLDGTWGRRMRDYGPAELWFREPWAPRSFGDDDHQARSTQLRRESAR